MDIGTGIGIMVAIIVGGALAYACWRPRRVTEPQQDPQSVYTPAGSAVLEALRSCRPAAPETPEERLLQGWR